MTITPTRQLLLSQIHELEAAAPPGDPDIQAALLALRSQLSEAGEGDGE